MSPQDPFVGHRHMSPQDPSPLVAAGSIRMVIAAYCHMSRLVIQSFHLAVRCELIVFVQ
jgi:hypothetical protein